MHEKSCTVSLGNLLPPFDSLSGESSMVLNKDKSGLFRFVVEGKQLMD